MGLQQNEYQSLGAEGEMAGTRRREAGSARGASGAGVMGYVRDMAGSLVDRVKSGRLLEVPIKGLTLVKLWSAAMFTFSFAMGMTW